MAKVTSSDDTTSAVRKAGVEKSGKNAGTKTKKAKQAKQALSEAEEQLAKALKQVEKLRSTVELLEGKLEKSKAKSQQWKAEARQERTKVAKLEAKLRRAKRDAPVDRQPPAERGDLPVDDPSVPDASWTVVRLRAAAREKRLPGVSRMTKAALLDALRS